MTLALLEEILHTESKCEIDLNFQQPEFKKVKLENRYDLMLNIEDGKVKKVRLLFRIQNF